MPKQTLNQQINDQFLNEFADLLENQGSKLVYVGKYGVMEKLIEKYFNKILFEFRKLKAYQKRDVAKSKEVYWVPYNKICEIIKKYKGDL